MSPGRLQEPSLLLLSALASGPQHGYALLSQVAELSAGEVVLRVGSLYGALDRLSAQGLVEVDREEVVDSRLRRYYRLTAVGATRLATDAARQRRQAETALRRLRAAGLHP